MEIKGELAHLDASDREALGVEYPVVAVRHLALGGDLCPQQRRTELVAEQRELQRFPARFRRGLEALALAWLATPFASVSTADISRAEWQSVTPYEVQHQIERVEDIAVAALRHEIDRYDGAG